MAKQQPIERNEHMAFGGLMKFGQQMIHQASIAVDCFYHPFDGNKSQNHLLLGVEDIPTGAILFSKVERYTAVAQVRKKRRLMEHTRLMSASTRRQPKVFSNVKYVTNYSEIVFAGVSDTEITIRNDDWRYRTGASVIPVISGTRTVMNTGPDDIYEGEWVYYEIPSLSKSTEFQKHADYDCHRAILRPVTLANYNADPDCIYRTVGKCVAFSRAGQMLDLSISSAVAPIPFGANPNPRDAHYSASAGPLPSVPVAAYATVTSGTMSFGGGDDFKFKIVSTGKDFMVYKEDLTGPLDTAYLRSTAKQDLTKLGSGELWKGKVTVNGVQMELTITWDPTKPELKLTSDQPNVLRTQGHSDHFAARGGHLAPPPAARRTHNMMSAPLPSAMLQQQQQQQQQASAGPRRTELGQQRDEEKDEEDEDEDSEDETITSVDSSSA
jgi:hypothetical protein